MSRQRLWIIAAAGLVFALILGVRQSAALFMPIKEGPTLRSAFAT